MGDAILWAKYLWKCEPRVIRGGVAEREDRIAARAAELRAENDKVFERAKNCVESDKHLLGKWGARNPDPPDCG